MIDSPSADTTTFTYTGSELIYNIAESEYYTVSGNKQTDAGTYKVTVSLNDKDNTLWSNGSKDDIEFDFVIHKAVPVVDAPTATPITFGEALSASTLSDTNWSWVDGTVIPTIQNSGYAAKTTVDDSNYDYSGVEGYDSENHTVTRTIAVTVNKATPTVTAPTASAITLGQTLAASTLSDSTWSWSDPSTKPTSAGTHSYTAVKTVSDADKYDYTALSGFTFDSATNTLSTNVSVDVRRAGASVTPYPPTNPPNTPKTEPDKKHPTPNNYRLL